MLIISNKHKKHKKLWTDKRNEIRETGNEKRETGIEMFHIAYDI